MPSIDKLIRITLKLNDEVSQPIQKAGMSLKQFGDGLTGLGTKMTVGITAPLVAFGTASVKAAMDLDKALRNIQSVGGQTESQIKALSQTFVDMSTDITKTTDTAENLALAFYDIQGSGFEGADAMKILEAATKAASAGLTTTATSAQGLTAVINSYGMAAKDAGYVSDIMFATVDRGVGSFEELVSSLSNVTPTAAAMNISFNDISAAIATMSKQGFTFSESTVSLNGALTELLKPSTELEAVIKKLGYSSGQAMVDALGLGGTMQALRDATGGTAEGMANLFGNVRSMRAAFALTGDGAQMFAEDLAAMGAAGGRTAEAFAVQTKSFEAQWKNFQNVLNALMIEVGQVIIPVLSQFLQGVVIPLIQAFRSLPEPVQQGAVAFLAILAAVGPVLAIFGQLVSGFVAIKAGILMLLPLLPAFWSALMGPIGIVIAALVALYAAYQTNFLGIKDVIDGFLAYMSQAWNALTGSGEWDMDNPVFRFFRDLGSVISTAWNVITNPIQAIQQALYILLTGQFAGTIFEEDSFIAKWLYGIRDLIFNFVPTMTKLGFNLIKGFITGANSVNLGKFFSDMMNNAMKAIKNALGIKSPSKVMAQIGKNVVRGFNQGIDAMGGLAVNTPLLNGGAISGNGATMGTGSSGMVTNSGGNTYNFYTQGTSEEQMRQIMRYIGKETKKRS